MPCVIYESVKAAVVSEMTTLTWEEAAKSFSLQQENQKSVTFVLK